MTPSPARTAAYRRNAGTMNVTCCSLSLTITGSSAAMASSVLRRPILSTLAPSRSSCPGPAPITYSPSGNRKKSSGSSRESSLSPSGGRTPAWPSSRWRTSFIMPTRIWASVSPGMSRSSAATLPSNSSSLLQGERRVRQPLDLPRQQPQIRTPALVPGQVLAGKTRAGPGAAHRPATASSTRRPWPEPGTGNPGQAPQPAHQWPRPAAPARPGSTQSGKPPRPAADPAGPSLGHRYSAETPSSSTFRYASRAPA